MKLNYFTYKMENKIRRVAIEKLMQIISVAMLIVFAGDILLSLASNGGALSLNSMLCFDRAAIFRGQIWRIITFIFVYPSASSPLLVLLALYFYYWTGSAVEGYWGKARFNLYYLFGIIGTVIAGLIVGYVDNVYLNLSIFLAFAMMFPETRVLLLFVIPVKVKWIGIAEGVLLLLMFLLYGWADRAAIIAAMVNFLLFFGQDLFKRIRRSVREYKRRKNNYHY